MKKFCKIIAILLLAGMLLALVLPYIHANAAETDADLWIDPVNGRDTNNGTSEATALKTIQAAKTKAATLSANGDVVVILKGGVYDATEPIEFGSSDSGKNGNTITYRAAEGEEVLISGGEKLTGWTLYDVENNIYVADIPSAAKLTRQFYVDGEPQPIAALEQSPTDWEEISNGFSVPSKYNFKDLWHPEHVEMNTLYLWYHRIEHFTGINSAGTEIYVDTECLPTWISNDYMFIDRIGEWYIDRDTYKIYYKADGTMDGKEAYLPVTEQVIQMDYASNITFEGITFSHTSFTHTSENRYLDQQANTHYYDSAYHQIPGGVELTGCTGITFDGCDITNMGTAGIRIKSDESKMSDGNKILNSRVYNISYSGIIVGEVYAHHGYESYQLVKNTTIQNNIITRIGLDMFDSPGITATYTNGTIIDHNEISYCPYSGISLGWGWGDEENDNNTAMLNEVGDAQVTNNYIHDVCKTNYDGGAFYSLGWNEGTVVSGNYIYNSGDGDNSGEISIYLDEGSAYMEVYNNVVGGQSSYWLQMFYPNIHDNNWHDNYYDSRISSRNNGENNTITNNTAVANGDFSKYPAATEVIENAGLLDESLKDGIEEGFVRQHDIVQAFWPGNDDRYIEPTRGWDNVSVPGQLNKTIYDSVNSTIGLVVDGSVDVTALPLTFDLLDGWTCDKVSGSIQDFSSPVTYTLKNGSYTVRWVVTVNQQIDSSEEIEGTEVDLSDAFTSSSNWTTAPSSVSGGVMTHGSYSVYIGEKFAQDSIFAFDLSIPLTSTGEWVAFTLKNQTPNTMCVSGGTEYYVGFNTDDVEVQKFVNGQRTVIFGEIDGFDATYGVLPNNFFTPGSFHSIRVGAINVEAGVRFFMYVDGNLVFDITDFSNTITADGYFGVYGMTKSISLRAFTDIQNTPDTTELDAALATAKNAKATDYTAASYRNLQNAITEAEEILSAYGGVTQAMADEACAVLTTALNNLEKVQSGETPTEPTAAPTQPTTAPTQPTEAPTEPTTPPATEPVMNKIDLTGCVAGICSSPYSSRVSYAEQNWYSSQNAGWRNLNLLVDGNLTNEVHFGLSNGERADLYLDLTKKNGSAVSADRFKLYYGGYQNYAIDSVTVILDLADGTQVTKQFDTNWGASNTTPLEWTFDQTYALKGVYVWADSVLYSGQNTLTLAEVELYQLASNTTEPTKQRVDLTGTVVGACSTNSATAGSYADFTWWSDGRPTWKPLGNFVDNDLTTNFSFGASSGERADLYLNLSKGGTGYTAVDEFTIYHSGAGPVPSVMVVLLLEDGTEWTRTYETNWARNDSSASLTETFTETQNAVGMYIWQNGSDGAHFGDIMIYQVNKATQEDIQLPEVTGLQVVSVSGNSITVTADPNANGTLQFRIDGGTWTTGNTFNNLTLNQTYTIEARYIGNTGYANSTTFASIEASTKAGTALVGTSYSIRLMEPWALRTNIRFFGGTLQSPTLIPLADIASYGAYAIIEHK
ncbi:MAG: right-handed parallel beta-helix repeat-containing protein, partial [Oscillospiraceae bacterium]|nr:right-handed parallel beta-helix repeat-containing protein [Oscillospiraceae bacterium]